jgi:hypothetical protein
MSKFKVGDKVRCVDNDGQPRLLTVGATYTVTAYPSGGNPRYVALESLGGYKVERFELVTPTNAYTVHDETAGGVYESFFTINEATEYIQQHGIAGHTYTVQEHIERRCFEVVEKVQRELKAI